jgi:hypothetical protein
MNELELFLLLLKLVCFISGLLVGILIGDAVMWQPLDRKMQRGLSWQARYAAQAKPLMTLPQPALHLIGLDPADRAAAGVAVAARSGGAS